MQQESADLFINETVEKIWLVLPYFFAGAGLDGDAGVVTD